MKRVVFPIKTGIFISLLLFFSVVVTGTESFFTASAYQAFDRSVSDLKVTLNDDGGVTELPVGQSIPRSITLTNDGTSNLFIRLSLHPILVSKKGLTKEVELSELIGQLNQTEWVDGQDGFYYYNKKLGTGADKTTAPIFQTIQATTTTNKEDTLTLWVKAETIIAAGTCYRDAWWGGEVPSSLRAFDKTLDSLKD